MTSIGKFHILLQLDTSRVSSYLYQRDHTHTHTKQDLPAQNIIQQANVKTDRKQQSDREKEYMKRNPVENQIIAF